MLPTKPSAAKREASGILTKDRAGLTVAYLGDLPADIWDVLSEAWDAPIYIASNFAREHRFAVALAASIGWISNVKPDGQAYSPCWHLTLTGHQALTTKH